MHRPLRIGRNWLALAALAFLGANLLHGADHIRQHLAGFTPATYLFGSMLTGAAVAAFVVARRRSRRAPLLAAVVGFTAAVLVTKSHATPHTGALSLSYIDDIHADALSWTVMLLEVAAGFVLGVLGVGALRARARGADDRRALTDGIERAAPGRTLQGFEVLGRHEAYE